MTSTQEGKEKTLGVQIYELMAGYEPVKDNNGKDLGYDLQKDGRTKFGFYWEYADMMECAKKIQALIENINLEDKL